MIALNKLSFFQYKNYASQNYHFWGKIVCICGANGSGKTNLIDAIYYLAYTKSYLGFRDAQMIKHNLIGLKIEAEFTENNELFAVKLINRENTRKEIWLNNEEQKQLLGYAGKFACIFIAPDDVEIITGSAEKRRRLLDATISNGDAGYLASLIQYNKFLQQRNALLKNWQNSGQEKLEVIQYYEAQMCHYSMQLVASRIAFMQQYIGLVNKLYNRFTGEQENIKITYISLLISNDLQDLFKQSLNTDIALGRTTCGPHKDDIFVGFSNGILFKEEASQGQKKTMLFALKLAQYLYLKQALNISPILLLDDVFEKLDTQRSAALLNFISEIDGQTFITDTQKNRLEVHFANMQNVQFVDM